ncbi:hypothetical protein GC194_02475 [bacterium]|nr:hypothetical protein [bacterium]
MEWHNSFFPVASEVIFKGKCIGNTIAINRGKMPDVEAAEVVFFAVERGAPTAANLLRNHLYNYINAENFSAFADLGNYIIADEFTERHVAEVGFILSELFEMGKTVLTHCSMAGFMPLAVEKAHEYNSEPYATVEVNLQAANKGTFGETTSADWLSEIIRQDDTFLYYYGLLAYQSNHVDAQQLDYLDKLGFESLRLGALKANLTLAEPMVRTANFLQFNTQAIQAAYVGGAHFYPNGLNGEEACAISKYAGANSQMRVFNLENSVETSELGAEQMAQMLWYFMEGSTLCYDENPLEDEELYIKYLATPHKQAEHLTFIKSRRTDKWWIYLPVDHNKYPRFKYLIPCAYSDYEMAVQGEIPHRWIQAAARLDG